MTVGANRLLRWPFDIEGDVGFEILVQVMVAAAVLVVGAVGCLEVPLKYYAQVRCHAELSDSSSITTWTCVIPKTPGCEHRPRIDTLSESGDSDAAAYK